MFLSQLNYVNKRVIVLDMYDLSMVDQNVIPD